MKIWFINHYAVPIKYYPLARTTNFAKYLGRMGHDVTIFAASSVHNSDVNLISDESLYKEEFIDDIHYVYVKSKTYKGNGKDRILNMFEFARKLPKVCKKFSNPDVIVASSATPPACMAGIKIAKRLGCKVIADISDLWPLSFVEYNMISRSNPLLLPMYYYEKQIYKKCDKLIFTMEGGYDYIKEKCWDKVIQQPKVFHINNGVDLEEFDYNKEHFQIQDEDLDNDDIFKIIYTGSIRKANNLGLILDVAKKIENNKIKFLIWGDGDELPNLKKRIIDENINNVVFKGRVDKKYIPYIVSNSTVNLVHGTYNGVLRYGCSPNKLFDYFASKKPIIINLDINYDLIKKFNVGYSYNGVKDFHEIINIFQKMSAQEYGSMCSRSEYASKLYSFENLTNILIGIIEKGE